MDRVVSSSSHFTSSSTIRPRSAAILAINSTNINTAAGFGISTKGSNNSSQQQSSNRISVTAQQSNNNSSLPLMQGSSTPRKSAAGSFNNNISVGSNTASQTLMNVPNNNNNNNNNTQHPGTNYIGNNNHTYQHRRQQRQHHYHNINNNNQHPHNHQKFAAADSSDDGVSSSNNNTDANFFDFSIENAEGLPVELGRLRGRVVIVTNVGTFASNAKAELEALNSLAHCYGENLAIIAVPCNHFHHEPTADTAETLAIMEHVRPGDGFRPNPTAFFLTTHGAVNGADQLPIFRFLKKALPLPADDQFSFTNDSLFPFALTWSPIERCDITGDFEKFVIRPDGKPIRRYTGHYPALNLFHDVAKLTEEFSLTADSAQLSSMRFLRQSSSIPSSTPAVLDEGSNNNNTSTTTNVTTTNVSYPENDPVTSS